MTVSRVSLCRLVYWVEERRSSVVAERSYSPDQPITPQSIYSCHPAVSCSSRISADPVISWNSTRNIIGLHVAVDCGSANYCRPSPSLVDNPPIPLPKNWVQVPCPFLPFFLPFLPLEVCPQLGDVGESCNLAQRGVGRSRN